VKPAVANMSLGGSFSSSVNSAVSNAVSAGVVFAVAAGNESTDACTKSPASTPNALTVGATGSNDVRASFSNYGSCLDIFAPGVSITSSTNTSDISTASWSGTSMASPHVAGAAALYLSANSSATPAQVESALEGNATSGKVTSAGTGSPNLLLYSLFSSGGGGNTAPTASFTPSCTDLTCTFNGSGSSDDAGIVSYSWNFGDNTNGSGVSVNHTYATAGTYTVVLTVTDNGGLTDTDSKQITVSAPPSSGISLNANGYKVKGVQHVDLVWSGATGNVDVWRGTTDLLTTTSASSFTDNIGVKGPGSYQYKVCLTGTTTCSNTVNVVF